MTQVFTIQSLEFQRTTNDEIDPLTQAWWNMHTRIGMPEKYYEDEQVWLHEFTEMAVWEAMVPIIGYGSNRAAHHLAALCFGAGLKTPQGSKYIEPLHYWLLLHKYDAKMPLYYDQEDYDFYLKRDGKTDQ